MNEHKKCIKSPHMYNCGTIVLALTSKNDFYGTMDSGHHAHCYHGLLLWTL